MTITKAIEHFKFKFTKVWNVTEHDVTAFNKIVDFVNDKHKKQLQQNELFAKLYIFAFSYYLKRYNCSVYDSEAAKELHQLLDKPLNVFIKRFTDVLNENDWNGLLKAKGLELKHPKQYTPEERKIYNNIDFSEWTFEDVQDILLTQINNVINEFK